MSCLESSHLTANTNCFRCKLSTANEDTATILGFRYHVTCLVCDNCGQNLQNGFHLNYGKFYCGKCLEKVVTACAVCNKIIGLGRSFKMVGKIYCSKCCACVVCRKPFNNNVYYSLDGKAYCLQDFWNQTVEKDQQKQEISETQRLYDSRADPTVDGRVQAKKKQTDS